MQRQKVSAFVISYNREDTIVTCVKALAFADEIILIDKSSTDKTVEMASPFVDKIYVVPWSPTVEETRVYAESKCNNDWIVFADDDECYSVGAIKFIVNELKSPRYGVYGIPLRHYILGVHNECAYYWPERQIRFYKKGNLNFSSTIHGGIKFDVEKYCPVPVDNDVCIHHLSHKSVNQWIEKSNRYTSQTNRVRMTYDDDGLDIIAYSHKAIDRWEEASQVDDKNGYVASVAIMRSLYDIIDRLKGWEEESKLDGSVLFKDCCDRLENEYDKCQLLSIRRLDKIEFDIDKDKELQVLNKNYYLEEKLEIFMKRISYLEKENMKLNDSLNNFIKKRSIWKKISEKLLH